MISRRLLLRSLPWVLVLLVAISEMFLLDWALRVTGSPGLGLAAATGGAVGMVGFHTSWTLLARRWRRSRSRTMGVEGLLFSLGALVSGGLIALVFVAVHTVSAWVPEFPKDQGIVIGGGIAILSGIGVLLYSMTLGQARVRVERIDIPVAGLDSRLEGLRIAHLSDLHIGPNVRPATLHRFIDRVNATNPDLILITGDIFDFDPSFIEEGCRTLDKLWAPHGTFAILGNHDLYTGAEAVAHGITSLTHIQLLRDAHVRLNVRDAPLLVVGIEDGGEGMADRGIQSAALDSLAAETANAQRAHDGSIPARLLMVHRPNFLPQIERLGFLLAFAGHTHGGQVSLPWPLEHWNVARLTTPWTRGLFQSGATKLYVNRGLGVGGLAMRWNCSREIALLTLRGER